MLPGTLSQNTVLFLQPAGGWMRTGAGPLGCSQAQRWEGATGPSGTGARSVQAQGVEHASCPVDSMVNVKTNL